MAFNEIRNIKLKGISSCIPSNKISNIDSSLFSSKSDSEKFIKTTLVEEFRVSNDNICTSDLCITAAETLIKDLKWDKSSIDCLIFVSQTPDYILPATSCIIQDKLGLPTDCYTLDISLGCSGWVYGMSVISSLLSNGWMKRGLLLVGDTISKMVGNKDKSTAPLFGDVGTATALEFDTKAAPMKYHFSSDGSGFETIIVPDGGYRSQTTENSFKPTLNADGEKENRNSTQLYLNGMDVFSFGISKAPQSVKMLSEKFNIDLESIDYFIFHQANGFMNEKIRTKLKIDKTKVPYSMDKYGNTSSGSIPLTICSELRDTVKEGKLKMIASGFGVGLSWGSMCFETDNFICSEIIEI